jgi:alpha-galactosidase
VYEHGWQSWSPTSTYRLGEAPTRATTDDYRSLNYRSGVVVPEGVYQGEGLLALHLDAGSGTLIAGASDARSAVASIRAEQVGDRVIVSADGPVDVRHDSGPGGLEGALARWADGFAHSMGVPPIRRAPTVWCSWYHYFSDVAEVDIDENLTAIGRHDLPIDVIQIDQGYEARIGDWLTPSPRFVDLGVLARRIRHTGRRAGIWVAPFLVGGGSEVAARHPGWIVRDEDGPIRVAHTFDDDLFALDLTNGSARRYLADVFGAFRHMGFDYFKIDFLYAGAIAGWGAGEGTPVAAYRSAMELIRESTGDAYLVACGAPILPSVGLVDAMRVSPDTAPHVEPKGGDRSEPSSRNAIITGRARAFQQGRWWVNDADCLIVRPGVEGRVAWADHVDRFSGLRASGDRIADLDGWGLATTRRLLSTSPDTPFVAS